MQFGLDPLKLYRSLRGFPSYWRDFQHFRSDYSGAISLQPYLHDRYTEAGVTKSEYFWQDLIVARWIHEAKPLRHVDVGSRTDGFVAHVASYREIEVFDVRPVTTEIPGVTFRQADLMDTAAMSAWQDGNAGGEGDIATPCPASMCWSTSGSVAMAIPSIRLATKRALPIWRACFARADGSTSRRRSARSVSSSTPIGSSIQPPSSGWPTRRGYGWSTSRYSTRARAFARSTTPSGAKRSLHSPASATISAFLCLRDPCSAQFSHDGPRSRQVRQDHLRRDIARRSSVQTERPLRAGVQL